MCNAWKDFQKTGLLLFVNMFLHIFGWAIVLSFDSDSGEVVDASPKKVSCRGFKEKDIEKAYSLLSETMGLMLPELDKNDVKAVADIHLHPCEGCARRLDCDGICIYIPSDEFVAQANKGRKANRKKWGIVI